MEITDKLINNTLFNLQIISSLNTNIKLSTNVEYNKLEIDTNVLPFLTRWYNGYTRENTLEIIKKTINNVYYISDYYFSNIFNEKKEIKINISDINNNLFFKETNIEKIKELLYAMENSLPGLYKLKTTYNTDNSIQIELDMLINKLIKRINKINNAIDIK